jgi:hypothetical protein
MIISTVGRKRAKTGLGKFMKIKEYKKIDILLETGEIVF